MNREIAQICHGTHDGAGEDSLAPSDRSNSSGFPDPAERDSAIIKWRDHLPADGAYDETLKTGGHIAEVEIDEEETAEGHETLRASEAYRWLISVLQRSSRLNGIDPNRMSSCREVMTQQLQALSGRASQGSQRLITSKRQPPLYRARFNLSWDPISFLQEECEVRSPGEVVSQVVTLSGDGRSVQAETCRGYLEQVWPTTGSEVMNLIADLVTRTGQSCECESLGLYLKVSSITDQAEGVLPDRTEISARLQDKTCVIEALGTQSSLGDLAEQLLWISTALRSPSSATAGMTLCSSELVPIVPSHGSLPIEETYHQRCLGTVDFHVAYKTTLFPDQPGPAEGDCWMQLFSSCRVVSGYPIPTRNPQRPGLELPLEIMASLVGADRVTPFGHDLVIKGYSDLLYATEQNEGCIIWHLICNKGELTSSIPRISFADTRIPRPADHMLSLLQPSDALLMRHIVGWTTTVRSNAGQFVAETAATSSLITDYHIMARGS